jgi:SAM-dependent methyltransferase
VKTTRSKGRRAAPHDPKAGAADGATADPRRQRTKRPSAATPPASADGSSDGPSSAKRPTAATAPIGKPARERPEDAFARLYDVDLLDDPGDLDLYLALAARAGDPILEVGVGSGRLAVPLAEAGHHVTGVDLDPAMLRRAHRHAMQAGNAVAGRLALLVADARDLPDDLGTFRLAFIALNSLLVFGGREDQHRAIQAIADHLEPGGLAVVDTWLPDADDLARYDGRLGLEYTRCDPETGHHVTKLASATYDVATSAVELTTLFDEGPQGEPPRRWIRHDRLRLIAPDELRGFAEDSGLDIELLAGGYDLTPLGPGADRAILVAVAPARPKRASPSRTATAAATRRDGSGGASELV